MADRPSFRLTDVEAAELRRVLGVRADVLIAARGPEAVVALLRDRMAVRRRDGWQLIAWADVQRGGWDSDTSRLYWELIDSTKDGVQLNDPGQLPHAFAERVRSSIAVTRHMTLTGDLGTVLVTGRRSPGSTDPVVWQVEPSARTDLGDPRVEDQVRRIVDDLRAEFE